jgi:5-methylcytosine-specific restriction protein A
MPSRPKTHKPMRRLTERHQVANPSDDWRKWYTHARWSRLRRGFLARNGLCVYCEREGRIKVATIVDHVIPHRGDRALFWDESNWQPLCKRHHDSTKAIEEGKNKRAR